VFLMNSTAPSCRTTDTTAVMSLTTCGLRSISFIQPSHTLEDTVAPVLPPIARTEIGLREPGMRVMSRGRDACVSIWVVSGCRPLMSKALSSHCS
jgi:hypothetical protein